MSRRNPVAFIVLGLMVLAPSLADAAKPMRSLKQPGDTRPLTEPQFGDPIEIARAFIAQHLTEFGLTPKDVSDVVIDSSHTSSQSGITHIYFRQRLAGIEVSDGNLYIHVDAVGRVLKADSSFASNLAKMTITLPAISADQAVQSFAASVDLPFMPLVPVRSDGGASQSVVFDGGLTSLREIPVELVYVHDSSGALRLAWDLSILPADALHWWSARVAAADGEVIEVDDWIDYDSYKVYALPAESPIHTSPPPPGDGATVAVNPASAGSPFGWHDTNGAAGAESNFTVGNNVDAYEDTNDSDGPTGGNAARADGGASRDFLYTWDWALQPGVAPNQDMGITNLFYCNNIIHDVLHAYGFDEASGNFQVNNYGNGGAGNDSVQAEAQDGGGLNNANFGTPPDGQRPRMQMYNWDTTNPRRDGDLDNGIIFHEYGHGVSNRLVGGGNNTNCLNSAEQAGEGWSDLLSLMLTHEGGDAGTDPRGIGNFALGNPPDGPGIRNFPYSTDMAVSPYVYDDIMGTGGQPHAVGQVWAAIYWEVYWAFTDAYGFDPDLYNGVGGNNRAIQYFIDGLKLNQCGPGFINHRDAVLQAIPDCSNAPMGPDCCLAWIAFAKRGLGETASQGSPNNVNDGTMDFNPPIGCLCASFPAPATTPVAGPGVDNEIVLTWNDSTTAGTTRYEVQRSMTLGGPYTPIATIPDSSPGTGGGPGYMWSDSPVSGGVRFYYVIFAVEGTCYSPATTEVSATTTGGCADMPTFAGLETIAGLTDCQLELSWSPGSSNCAASVTYDVHRAITTGFTPSAANRVATGLSGTTYVDSTGLSEGTTYYYIVRAVDTAGASSDGNTVERSGVPGMLASYASTAGGAIPDNTPAGVDNVINVTDSGNVLDVKVTVNITHTWVGDLIVTLRGPTGAVILVDRPGYSGTGFGCGDNNMAVTVKDGAGFDLEGHCAGTDPWYSGTGDPAQPLSGLAGQAALGNWTLNVSDNANQDTGRIDSWSLDLVLDGCTGGGCAAGSLSKVSPLYLVAGATAADIDFSWPTDPVAIEYHVNSVDVKEELLNPNRSNPLVTSVCTVSGIGCSTSTATADAVFYQVLSACGAGVEGPF